MPRHSRWPTAPYHPGPWPLNGSCVASASRRWPGDWSCADPAGAAWRLLAMHDGLVGFVPVGAPALSRRAARVHLRTAISHEFGTDGVP